MNLAKEDSISKICNKTVMDSTDPSISFDENGISNHYYEFTNNTLPIWKIMNRASLNYNINLIKESSKNQDFDCILGLSGGLDSSYMLHKVVTQFGLRPLVFHVDAGWNSELATHNIRVLIEKLKLDLFTEVINWEEMKEFQLAMFKSGVPHLDIPQDMAFISVLYKFAKKYRIKYILNGGNIATESVKPPIEYLYWGSDFTQVKDILSKFSHNTFPTYPFTNIFYHKIYLRYLYGVKTFKPLNYMKFIKKEAEKELESIYGWRSYPQKHFESKFTKFFEGYWLILNNT